MRTTIRTKSLVGVAAAVALLAALSACASSTTPPAAGSSSASSTDASSTDASSTDAPAAGSSESAPASDSAASGSSSVPADLAGVTFVATEVTGDYTIVPSSTISLTFEDGSLSAKAGCNNLFGAFTIEGDVLTAPQLGSTRMACDEALMAQDTWLAAFLASSPTWMYADGVLTLTDGTDTIAFTGAAGGAEALELTGWKVVGLIAKTATADTTSALDASLNAWMRFSGGEVAFNNSCNLGGGSAEIADDSITFGALRSTLIFCDGPSGEAEAAMSAVLQGTTPYTLADDPAGALLTIMSEDGTSGLQLMADPTVGADAFAPAAESAEVTASSTG